jgi:hypothetical protein
MITTIKGNLLNSKEKYIAHQVNAVSRNAAGLASSIFCTFPYADIYSSRKLNFNPIDEDFPGNISIKGNGNDERYVINMIAQYYPGKSQSGYNSFDSKDDRLKYFNRCLSKIAAIKDLQSIAMPKYVGCNLAGGNWEDYNKLLEIFAERIENEQGAKLYLYEL